MTSEQGRRKTRVATVVSDKMDKTRVVVVHWSQRHRLYKRNVKQRTKFKAHDKDNASREGDQVRIVETRPLSKDKRWRITEILVRGERVELRPTEVDTTLLDGLEHGPEKRDAAGAPKAQVVAEPEAPAEEAPTTAAEPEASVEPEPAPEAKAETEEVVAEPEAPTEEEADGEKEQKA